MLLAGRKLGSDSVQRDEIRRNGPRRFYIGDRKIVACRYRLIKVSSWYQRANWIERRDYPPARQTHPGPKGLVPGRERQQGDIPGLLDGAGQTALMRGADAGQAARNDLAALGHKPLQQTDIAVGDGVDLLGTELAHLLAAKELAAAAGTAAASTRAA